jgi:transcriptional regulator
MYLPEAFHETRSDVLHALIASHPLGVLFTHGRSGLDANHLPFELRPEQGRLGTLQAHVSRANPLWQDVADGDEVLAVFRAGDAYISPTWYPSKHEQHRQVPTWNYSVVHVRGRISIHDDERFVRGLVGRLTRTHEAAMPAPWKMSDAPRDFIDTLLQAIVGLSIEITALEGKAKLGQNKEVRDIEGAGLALQARGQHAVGDAMLACAAHKKANADPA